GAVVGQWDAGRVTGQDLAVELHRRDAPAHAVRVLDRDLVGRRSALKVYLVASPAARDAWIDDEGRPPKAESQDRFDAGLVHPAGRAGVPGPPATTHVRRLGVDVRRHHIRFDLVAVNAGASAGV